MAGLFIWRIHIDEENIKRNIDERVASASLRIANTVTPLVYNIYQKATERHFTEETASAILDAELNAEFISMIKVYGNFGHLFMGKFKNEQGQFKPFDKQAVETAGLEKLKSMRTPVKLASMTIGNIEVYYSYTSHQMHLRKTIAQELLQISIFTLLIISLFYLIRKTSIKTKVTERALRTLASTQEQLLASEKLLKDTNLTLEQKVRHRTGELQSTNEQLLSARKIADAANQAKSLFLANMSHEIRTPMNGVIGLTELLSRTELTSQQKDYLDKLQYSSNNLLHILNDILDLSKIEAGKFNIEHQAFNFSEMLTSILNIAKVKADEKSLRLSVKVEQPFSPMVVGDCVRCSQVLSNLLNNAIKFTHSGRVSISAHRPSGDDMVYIEISDTGIGITEEQQKKLFSTFTQADDSTSRKYGGTGLGLVICKHLISLMKGSISLESEPNKGSTFRFSIYLPVSHQPSGTPTHSASKGAQSELEPSFISQKLRNRSVLLVEDVEINRVVAENILEHAGLLVESAVNGVEAVKKAKRKQYDMIIMDIQMPEMDGYEATRTIRKLPNYENTPIVAMTANAMSDDKRLSLDAGMNSHLTKPIQFEQVISELERFF
jgi:signal transduction histidine kinase